MGNEYLDISTHPGLSGCLAKVGESASFMIDSEDFAEIDMDYDTDWCVEPCVAVIAEDGESFPDIELEASGVFDSKVPDIAKVESYSCIEFVNFNEYRHV